MLVLTDLSHHKFINKVGDSLFEYSKKKDDFFSEFGWKWAVALTASPSHEGLAKQIEAMPFMANMPNKFGLLLLDIMVAVLADIDFIGCVPPCCERILRWHTTCPPPPLSSIHTHTHTRALHGDAHLLYASTVTPTVAWAVTSTARKLCRLI